MFYNVENNFRSYEEDFKSAGSLEAKFNIMKELAHDINSIVLVQRYWFKEKR